jgi:hypothetical protein
MRTNCRVSTGLSNMIYESHGKCENYYRHFKVFRSVTWKLREETWKIPYGLNYMETAAFSSGISTPATRTHIWNLFTEPSHTKDGKSLVTFTEILKLLNRGTVCTESIRCFVCLITRDLTVQSFIIPATQIFSDGRLATRFAAPASKQIVHCLQYTGSRLTNYSEKLTVTQAVEVLPYFMESKGTSAPSEQPTNNTTSHTNPLTSSHISTYFKTYLTIVSSKTSRPVLGPTQPPIQHALGFLHKGKAEGAWSC